MEKRYQVFVSSTYTDLLEARREVMQALLELDCIPAGMELFPAADEDQWSLIKQVISDCDYYIVIIAGRYGSIGMQEKSFTQLEYEYATSQGKPVIAFLHNEPGTLPANMTEKDPKLSEKLEIFRELARQKVVRHWTTPTELGSVVSRSVVKLIKNNPAIGWVKADSLASEDPNEEILKLRKQVDELQHEIERVRTTAPKETVHLAQGEDQFEIRFTARQPYGSPSEKTHSGSYFVSWSQIFARLSPLMIEEASDRDLKLALEAMTGEINKADIPIRYRYIEVDGDDFNSIKVQLIALKLITRSVKKRSLKNSSNYWMLTPYGATLMIELRAIRKIDTKLLKNDGHRD